MQLSDSQSGPGLPRVGYSSASVCGPLNRRLDRVGQGGGGTKESDLNRCVYFVRRSDRMGQR